MAGAWRGVGLGWGVESGAAAPGGEIDILNEKELIFCTQEILNY